MGSASEGSGFALLLQVAALAIAVGGMACGPKADVGNGTEAGTGSATGNATSVTGSVTAGVTGGATSSGMPFDIPVETAGST